MSLPDRPLNRAMILAVVMTSYLMIVLDISIVITALPKIRQGLDFTPITLSWVQNAYTLAFGGLLLLGARAGDVLGRKRMFMIGLAVFTASSLVIGLAPDAGLLLAARAVQGVSAAVLAPATLALISTTFPEGAERTRAMSLYAATAGVAASLDLVVGGLIAGSMSWRVGFFINGPIGLFLLWAAHRHLVESERRPGTFDLVGAVVSTGGMVALVHGVVRAAELGWSDGLALASLAAGIALLAVFLWVERRAAQPILPLRLFSSRERVGAYAGRFLFLGAMVGFWFFTTQYFQSALGYAPFAAGLAFLPTTLVNFGSALLAPRLTRKLGNGVLLTSALLVTLAGLAWLSLAMANHVGFLGLVLPLALIGAGQGAALGPLTIAGVAGVEPRDAGAASGAVNVAHQIGGSLGLAVQVAVFAAAGPGLMAHQAAAALAAGSLMLAGSLVCVLMLIVRPRAGVMAQAV